MSKITQHNSPVVGMTIDHPEGLGEYRYVGASWCDSTLLWKSMAKIRVQRLSR